MGQLNVSHIDFSHRRGIVGQTLALILPFHGDQELCEAWLFISKLQLS